MSRSQQEANRRTIPPPPGEPVFLVSSRTGPVYAVRAQDQAAAERYVAANHEPGVRLKVTPDDGTAARQKLAVLPLNRTP
jgi:hypothetical protein